MASIKKKKEVLFLYVDAPTKRWLKSLCKTEEGYVSLSTMAQRIFSAHAKKIRGFGNSLESNS